MASTTVPTLLSGEWARQVQDRGGAGEAGGGAGGRERWTPQEYDQPTSTYACLLALVLPASTQTSDEYSCVYLGESRKGDFPNAIYTAHSIHP